MANISIILGALVYFAIVLFVGWQASIGETREEYLVGARKFSGLTLAMSMMSSYTNVGWILVIATFLTFNVSYLIWMAAGFNIIYLMLALFTAPVIWRVAKEKNISTMIEYLRSELGPNTAKLAAVITTIVFFAWAIIEYVAIGSLLAQTSDLSYEWAIVVLSAVVGVYLWFGGFVAVIRTDQIQFWLIIIFLVLLAIFGNFEIKTEDVAWLTQEGFTWVDAVGVFLAYAIVQIMAPEGWQRIIAAKSAREAQKSQLYTFFFWLPYFAIILFLGLNIMQANPGFSDVEIAHHLIFNTVPSYLLPLVMVVCIAMIMSTLDTIYFIMGQTVSNDGVAPLLKQKVAHPRRMVRFGILACLIVVTGCALVFRDITALVYFLIALWACLLPGIYALFPQKYRPRDGAIVLSILAFAAGVSYLQLVGAYSEKDMLYLAPATLLLAPVLSWMQGKLCKTSA